MTKEGITPVPILVVSFLAPEQDGEHMYICKTTYQSDIKGAAFYAFGHRVGK